jgi:hypothetical protein
LIKADFWFKSGHILIIALASGVWADRKMRSVTGYPNDIFVSYAHADNEGSDDFEP